MLLYTSTAGALTSGDISVNKGIESLLIRTGKELADIDLETISIWVEKGQDDNVDICTNMPLRTFMLMSTFGTAAMFEIGGVKVAGICELTQDGYVQVKPGENLRFRINNMSGVVDYSVYGIESPIMAKSALLYDLKNVQTDEQSKVFGVRQYDMLSFDTGYSAIDYVNFTFDNGKTVRMTPVEMRAIQIDTDPQCYTKETGSTVAYHDSNLTMPLVGVVEIEIWKAVGTSVNVWMRGSTPIQTP